MLALLGAILFTIIAIMTVLVACGLPLGEFTMGGKHKVLPGKLRIMAVLSFVIQVFAIIIILHAGEYLPLWFSYEWTKGICIFFAAHLSLNIIMNILSNSKKEKYIMTPLSALAAVCFWITALSM